MTCSWANVMKAKRQTMAASESCHQATKQLHTETCQMLFGSTQKRGREWRGPARNGTTTIKEKRRKSGVRLSAKWQPLVLVRLGCVGIFWQIEKNIKTAAKDSGGKGKGNEMAAAAAALIESKQSNSSSSSTPRHYTVMLITLPCSFSLTHSLHHSRLIFPQSFFSISIELLTPSLLNIWI